MTQTKKTRGKAVKPAMVYVGLRLPQETLDFYTQETPLYTARMRNVLTAYANNQLVKAPPA